MDINFEKRGMQMKQMNLDAYSPLHKTGHTSKGDQRKWKIDQWWYKADYMGYEGLAEVLISRLLMKSSLQQPLCNMNRYRSNIMGKRSVDVPAGTFCRRMRR